MKRALLLLLIAAPMLHAQSTYALIVAGLGGEKEFDTQFADLSARVVKGLRAAGMPADHVIALSAAQSRKETIASTFQDLASRTKAADTLLLFLIGHGSFDEHEYKFNVAGPDPTAADFKAWLDKVPAARQVVINSTSSSGAVTELWSRAGRVVITATRNGQERNATVFMRFFAEALTDPAADVDKNGAVSTLEAFKYAEQKVKTFFESAKRLATEHPLLDDNGDGKGVADPNTTNGEGLLAATVPLVRLTGSKAALDTPEARTLRAHKEEVENQIAMLKYGKASLEKGEYDVKLQTLILDLARTQQKLEALEAVKP